MRLGETDLARLPALVALVERWAAEGIDYIQIREKDLSAKALLHLSLALAAAVARAGQAAGVAQRTQPTQLLMNSRPDLAIAAGLGGVHLTAGQGVLEPGQVRRLYASRSLKPPTVSVSCHTLEEVRHAVQHAADLILFGPVFGKSVFTKSAFDQSAPDKSAIDKSVIGKPVRRQMVTPPAGLDALSAACEAAGNIPVLALGGITQANTAACLEAGAKGIAAITLFNS